MPEAWICGVDEAGRGPIAGPVYAAAVVLDPSRTWDRMRDSKRLSPARREALALEIEEHALAWAVARAEVEEIDRLNILNATLLAMTRAVGALPQSPAEVWVDGNRAPSLDGCRVRTFVGGDNLHAPISAASIIAKTRRDAEMLRLHERYPQYRFDRHKGYPTSEHLALLGTYGACEVYRRSFAPVRRVLGRA